MASKDYGTVPSNASIKPEPFTLSIPEDQVSDFKTLLKLSKLPPVTWESRQTDGHYGINHDWLSSTKDYWLNKFDWRAQEGHINSFPNFKVSIKDDDGEELSIHFAALFSEKPDAIPIAMFHGWPGSFLEFLPLLGLLKKAYTPQNLPYHIIVPSLPGYTLSSGPPVNKDWKMEDAARIMNKLVTGLGFQAYIAQGGDIGSFISRLLAADYDACKAYHLNMLSISNPPEDAEISDFEKQGMKRGQEFRDRGFAYAQEHATKPATIGAVLCSSPLAYLAWIGEKFLDWTDDDPSLDTILESVTLWYFTETQPRAIYPYRVLFSSDRPTPKSDKPMGFSYFPKELFPAPKSWTKTGGNLVYYNQHEKGGHFAAMERPSDLLGDVEAFVKAIWPKVK